MIFSFLFLFCVSVYLAFSLICLLKDRHLPKDAYLTLRRRNSRRRLEVVRVEVLLEVEVRQLVALLEAEQREELGVGVDVTLVHQVVLLDVARDELRDVGAALQGARRAAQEGAQRRRDARRHLEEADARRLALLALRRRLAAAALVSDLLHLGRRLLQALGLADHLRELLTHLDKASRQRLDLGLELLLLDLRRLGLGRHNGRRGRRNRRRNNRLSLDRLLGGLRLRSRRRRRRHNGRHRSRRRRRRRLADNLGRRSGRRRSGRRRLLRYRRNRHRNILLLRDTLGSGGGLHGGGRAHNTRGRDRRRGHFTQDLPKSSSQSLNFWLNL